MFYPRSRWGGAIPKGVGPHSASPGRMPQCLPFPARLISTLTLPKSFAQPWVKTQKKQVKKRLTFPAPWGSSRAFALDFLGGHQEGFVPSFQTY